MQTFKTFLTERFINSFKDDLETRQKYADQVWNILQKSYESIGGIKGSGFNSKEEMIKKIPMWKMIIKNGIVHGVVMYKDKGGRKSVAMGSDGSDYAINKLKNLIKADLSRAFGEKSKGSLGTLLKTVPWSVLEPFAFRPDDVKRATGKEVIPLKNIPYSDIPDDGKMILKKFPFVEPYAYLREIGDTGKLLFKVAFGTSGMHIK